jgi:hypothetical protein
MVEAQGNAGLLRRWSKEIRLGISALVFVGASYRIINHVSRAHTHARSCELLLLHGDAVRLIDFGLARRLQPILGAHVGTRTNAFEPLLRNVLVQGKNPYMPPEVGRSYRSPHTDNTATNHLARSLAVAAPRHPLVIFGGGGVRLYVRDGPLYIRNAAISLRRTQRRLSPIQTAA